MKNIVQNCETNPMRVVSKRALQPHWNFKCAFSMLTFLKKKFQLMLKQSIHTREWWRNFQGWTFEHTLEKGPFHSSLESMLQDVVGLHQESIWWDISSNQQEMSMSEQHPCWNKGTQFFGGEENGEILKMGLTHLKNLWCLGCQPCGSPRHCQKHVFSLFLESKSWSCSCHKCDKLVNQKSSGESLQQKGAHSHPPFSMKNVCKFTSDHTSFSHLQILVLEPPLFHKQPVH